MYDIRQFRPTLFLVLLLGMTNFALAAQSPGVWIIGAGGLLISGWLTRTGRYRPLPRWLANAATSLAFVWVVLELRRRETPPIIAIGQFLVLLQLVKLLEIRANRDYGQLLVLSLLLIVAAAISTASLASGMILFAYLLLALYCCLLFHLKVETDHAKSAIGVAEDKLNPATLRQDQRYLPRSMRRLTVLVSTFSIAMAVLVFLFFPRNTGAGMLNPLQFRPSQTLTGFNDTVSFQRIAAISQNREVAAYVKLWRREPGEPDQPVDGTRVLLLRGLALDRYTGNDSSQGSWQWMRTNRSDDDRELVLPATIRSPLWQQEITLLPTGTPTLFAIAGPVLFKPVQLDGRLRFSRRDQSLRAPDPLQSQVKYEVLSDGHVSGVPPEEDERPLASRAAGAPRSVIDPQIAAYARRSEVSGSD
ncbi:MAG: DUF3488 domain-containing protein, partial [Tepidisphaeraceae bacterium]